MDGLEYFAQLQTFVLRCHRFQGPNNEGGEPYPLFSFLDLSHASWQKSDTWNTRDYYCM
jgi:hypothetical protein